MYSISANRNKVAYDIKRFIVDLTSDIQTLPTDCSAGSTAFVVENSSRYMLNNNKQWVKIQTSSGSSGEGGEGGGGGDGDDTDMEIIYDGGVI